MHALKHPHFTDQLDNLYQIVYFPNLQAQLPIKQLDVDTWTYQNINSVFHNPEALELSEEEKIDMAKKQKIIKHDNTRISKAPWKTEKQMEQLKKEAEKQEALAAGKVRRVNF